MSWGTTVADCRSLTEIQQIHVDPSGEGNVVVSLPPENLTLRNLLCAATALGQDRPEWKKIRVKIFDSRDVAEHYLDWERFSSVDTAFDRSPHWEHESHKRAIYVIDRTAREEYLLLQVLRLHPEKYETRIDLPLNDQPKCRFEIAGRCLIVIGDRPPDSELEGELVDGTVTVLGEVTRTGTLTKLHVVEANTIPPGANDIVAQAAMDHLHTWRLDPAGSEDSVAITYRFVTERSAGPPGGVMVRFPPLIEMSSSTDVIVTRRESR